MKLFRIFLLFIAVNLNISAEFKKSSIIVDARAEKLIKNILERLCSSSKRLSVPKIYFVVDKTINAFATEEAKIFIHTGLIIKLNIAQIIAVLAHELGHITGGHIHRMNSEMKACTAASIIGTLLGGAAALAGAGFEGLLAGTMLGQGAAMGTYASFSRTHEKEADAAGFRMLQAAGLSTEGFISTFELFKKMNSFGEIPYVQTHPTDQDRINAFKEFRAQNPDKGSIPEEWKEEFEIVQAIFMANLVKPQDVERFYYKKDTSAAKIAKVILAARKCKYNEAFAKLDDMLKNSPNNPYLHEMYGQFLLESGKTNAAVEHLRKAVELASDALSIRLLYSQALFKNGDASNAIKELNRITQDDPGNAMAWHLKAGAYRKLNQPEQADIAQAEYAMRTGDFQLAKKRGERAKKSKDPKIKEQATSLLALLEEYKEEAGG